LIIELLPVSRATNKAKLNRSVPIKERQFSGNAGINPDIKNQDTCMAAFDVSKDSLII